MRLAYKAETHELSAWRPRNTMELHTERLEAAGTPPEPDSPYHQSGLRVCKSPALALCSWGKQQGSLAHAQHIVVASRMSQLNDGPCRLHIVSTRASQRGRCSVASHSRAGMHIVGNGAVGAVRSL